MKEKDGRIVKTAVEARGARLGRPVLIDCQHAGGDRNICPGFYGSFG
jgi:hypothetical protein